MVERLRGQFSARHSCLRLCFSVSILQACIRPAMESWLTALIPGFSVSFGVFQSYYTKIPEFRGNPYIPVVGTMASGIPYLGGPVMAVFVRRYQYYRLYIVWIGWPLCIMGLVAGSFANGLGSLIFTQGIMYGCKCRLLFNSIYLILKKGASWFRHLLLPHHQYSK